jgi:acyl-CoA dehydrogenase
VIAPHPLATLRFTDCRMPASAMIGAPGQGFRIAMSVLDVFRVHRRRGGAGLCPPRAGRGAGAGHELAAAVQGAPLFDLQMVQGHIADMALDVDAAALLVYRAAWTKDSRARRASRREAAMAKLFATDRPAGDRPARCSCTAATACARAMAVERLYREIRALRIYEGASDVQRES